MTDLTEGQRIYAVGDLHGRLDLLTAALARIRADIAARPHADTHVIFLGDYVDRGPEVRGVIDALIATRGSELRTSFLLGNHDTYIGHYLRDPEWYDRSFHWLHDALGGNATLRSYDVPNASSDHPVATRDAFAAAFPPEHMAFLDACQLTVKIGGYLFVHAGIRPGVALADQDREDLIWIRDPFLTSEADFGFKVVHGHTIVPAVEHHRNRIAIDTGAVRTGRLACLVLEGEAVDLLDADGLHPLPLGAGLRGGLGSALAGGLKGLWSRR